MEKTLVAITGASSGIGEAFARKLAPGHDLLLIARRQDRLQALADEFANKFETRTEILQADLTKDDELETAVERLATEQRLSLLVNNAGFGTRGRFWEAELTSQEKMHKLHVMATVRLTHAALRNMVRRDFGGIVNVASVSSFVRSPGTTSYSATKAWMSAFTEGLHLELKGARSSVVVQALCPGFTYSEFQEAMGVGRQNAMGPGWWLTSEEVVDASIEGLRRRKLFVIPGWRYKFLVGLLTRLPTSLRLQVESMGGPARVRRLPVNIDTRKKIASED
ncbi:MAG TPA: SDR family oxidoreductase [Bryobacteraceae bacterium]|nr:SDR family oxidoreductase [Bryobacteraceae bacterium]